MYHVNPKTGEADICKAKIKCGFNTDHFDSKEEALTAYSEALEKEYLIVQSFKKDEVNPEDLYEFITLDEERLLPESSFDTSNLDPIYRDYYGKVYEHYEGVPRIESRTRVVYFFEDHVVKVPLNDEGETSNSLEVNASKNQDIPIAKSEFIDLNFDGKRVEVMKMERVRPVVADYKSMPSWIYNVDCGQVGLNPANELVAYDL